MTSLESVNAVNCTAKLPGLRNTKCWNILATLDCLSAIIDSCFYHAYVNRIFRDVWLFPCFLEGGHKIAHLRGLWRQPESDSGK